MSVRRSISADLKDNLKQKINLKASLFVMEQLGPMFNEPKAPYLVFHFQKETVLCFLLLPQNILITVQSVLHNHRHLHLICIALVVDQIWGVLCDRPVEQTLNQVRLNYAVYPSQTNLKS